MEDGGSSMKFHEKGDLKKTLSEVAKLKERVKLSEAEGTSLGGHSKNLV